MHLAPLRVRDYVAISAYAFALSYMWNSLGPIILPQLIERAVPPDAEARRLGVQATRLGDLRIIGLFIAIVVQPVAGALSDKAPLRSRAGNPVPRAESASAPRSGAAQGKRKPYILAGTLGDFVFLSALLLAPDYFWLVLAYVGLQFVSNIAHGAYQGFIPDLVATEHHGAASGAKNLFEIVALIVTSLVIASLFGAGAWAAGFFSISLVLGLALLITLLGVREERAHPRPEPVSGGEGGWRALFALDRRRDVPFIWWLASRFCMLLGIYFLQTYAFLFVRDMIPQVEPNSVVGPLLALIGLLVALSVQPAGVIADVVGHKAMTLAAGALNAAGVFLMIFASGRVFFNVAGYDVRDILLFAVPVGFGTGIFLVCNWALGIQLAPDGAGGKYLGISNLATAGAGLAAGLGGRMIDAYGYAPLFAFGAFSILFGMALLVKVRVPARAASTGSV